VHEFAGVPPVLSAERLGIFHHRLFFYLPHVAIATSPKQVYFSHDLPYLYAVCFHPPNCFLITIATDIVAYW